MAEIRFEKENSRAAAYDGGNTAGKCDVVMQRSFWIITHTEVDPAYAGQGIAGKLVDCVMQEAKAEGVRVKPFCSYAAHRIDKNPVYKEMEDKSMITVYGMKSCPDCSWAKEQVKNNPNFRFIDIGEDVRNMKTFIRLRDKNPVFDAAKKSGSIGIPCFVMEDGTLTLDPLKVGIAKRPEEGAACRIDGTGC